MSIETLKQVRNVLLRTALISIILVWLFAALTIAFWDQWAAITSQLIRTPTAGYGSIIANWFGAAKFYVIFVLLAPALGLHWEIKSREKHNTRSEQGSIDQAARARGV